MPTTTRRRLVPVAVLAIVLLAVAAPSFASTPLDAPAAPIDWMIDLWSWLVEGPLSERTGASSKATIPADGSDTAPPIVLLSPDGDGTSAQDGGESVPNLDPNG